MRLAAPSSAHSLRLVVVLVVLVMGATPSPAMSSFSSSSSSSSSGCPDRCVCDDQRVVQCAGQHLSAFPVDLPLATRQLIISNNRIAELPPLALNYLSDLVYLDCSNTP
ncbi:hypothetical protein CRUP_011846 [Coryphaenoides rupestris]|nr:hypothetical protein CRUP_011846 [Coryphaenoides rupestris]